MVAIEPRRFSALFAANVASVMGARTLYLATRLMLPAIILAYVTLAEFGIWSICFILISQIGMSAFGLANTYVREVADCHAQGDLTRVSRVFSTGLVLVIAGSAVLLPLLWHFLPALIALFNIDPALSATARVLIFGAVTVFLLDLSLGSFVYLLQGLQEMRLANAVWVAAFLLETALCIALLVAGAGIMALLIAFAVRYVFSSIAYFVIARRLVPGLRVSVRLFDRASLRIFFSFGLITQATGMLSMFLRSIEKLLAGLLVGVEATAVFEIGEKFPATAPSIPGAFNSAAYPAFAYLHAQGRRAELTALYLRNGRYVNLLAGAVMGFLAAFTVPILDAWLGAGKVPADAALVMLLFTLPFQLDVLTGPGSAACRAMGEPRRELVYHLVQLAMIATSVSALLLAGVPAFHAIAYGVAGSMIASALFFIAYCNRHLAVSQRGYLKEALLPGLAPYAIGALVALGLGHIVTIDHLDRLGQVFALGVAGIAYSSLCLVVFTLALSSTEERAATARVLARFMAFGTATFARKPR